MSHEPMTRAEWELCLSLRDQGSALEIAGGPRLDAWRARNGELIAAAEAARNARIRAYDGLSDWHCYGQPPVWTSNAVPR